jgi:hypothetical protein
MSVFLFSHEEECNHKLNIDDLYERKQRRDLKQISIFNKILGRIHKKIHHTSSKKQVNETHVWFFVPEYIVGEPIYDKGECIGYLVSQLEKNGFHIKYMHPNTLFISWHNWVPSYVRNEVKKKIGIILDEKGNVIGKKEETDESKSNMLTDNPLDNMLLKQQNTVNYKEREKEQKQYISVKNYKPSGNLVYTSDMFEKLEKKIAREI